MKDLLSYKLVNWSATYHLKYWKIHGLEDKLIIIRIFVQTWRLQEFICLCNNNNNKQTNKQTSETLWRQENHWHQKQFDIDVSSINAESPTIYLECAEEMSNLSHLAHFLAFVSKKVPFCRVQQGRAGQGRAEQGSAKQHKAEQGSTRQHKAEQGSTRQSKAEQGSTRKSKAA